MFRIFFPAALIVRPARQPFRPASLWVVALTLCASAIGPSAHAQQTLSLDTALRLAEERSRQLVAQDAAAGAARSMAMAAGQLPDPVLKAGISNLPVNGSDRFSLTRDFMTMRSIGVMQEFTRSDKRQARAARFDREVEVAEAGRAVALANLRRDTATAWLDRYYQGRMRDLLQTQRAELNLQIEGADAAYRGGRGTQADVFTARSALAQLDDRILAQERQIATAQTRLARWVGPGTPQPSTVLPDLGSVRLDARNLEAHIGEHPQIALMARQEAVARAEADIAQSNKRSDWTVELMYSQRGPAYSNMVSLNVSIPLQLDQKNRQDRELAGKLATAEQMQAQREEATRESAAEALSLLQQWQSNRKRLALYDSSLIPLASERTQAVLAAYRGGAGTLSAALEARRMEIDTRMERLRLEMETAGLWAQLEFLIPGGHLPLAASATTTTVDAKEPQQ
ncbi:transporter [Variovorax paradoxus]|jgi:outer membrane protein TolC|uniref:TolC family protein n=1 Tax=Variovorax TaxID=34072 RepID=UPI0006E6E3C0|nr:TolC family protein [Variovorax boronicumulans]KPU89561.1 transporter [Variovorax paradoxus]KPU99330.1 transporter [Variovorax paradoxus]KPV01013.1 transporter [Variovorax paradoxus]KPV16673.1 transporter [Variovorax paradoxus]KPV26488.1 transporter [Variovorax paradoxus]